MTNKKKQKSVVKLKEEKNVEVKPQSKSSERIMSFDVFFQLRIRQGKALAHHRAPMRKYAESLGLTEGTQKEFEKLFERY